LIRKPAVAALLATVAALATMPACSSGRVTQTSGQVAAVSGVNANAGDNGEIALRDLLIAYNGPGGYPIGSDAALIVRIFNNGLTPVRLVGATAEGVGRIELVSAGGAPPADATPTPGTDATPSPGASETPAPTPEPAGQSIQVDIAGASYALLVPGQGAHLQLVDLHQPLAPGGSVPVTFRFESGSKTYTVEVTIPMAPPAAPLPRVSADVTE
jgi:copper(I)-binding protein